jgi:hypothetical protein
MHRLVKQQVIYVWIAMPGVLFSALAPTISHAMFETLDEIQEFATRWLWTCNHDRPNIALGGITPKQKLALAA